MIPNPMLILAVVLAFLANGFYWHAKGANGADTRWIAKINQERAEASEAARSTEKKWQEATNEQTKQHQTRITAIRRNLDIALDGLRDRPERSINLPATARTDIKDCNGAELARSHAEFLERYAATAATQDAALVSCYRYADALR